MKKHSPPLKHRWPNSLKGLYRICRWQYLKIISRGRVETTITVDPRKISFGQTPESQFSPKQYLGGYQDGDWDYQVLPVESHPLYQSYVIHFLDGKPWEDTPFFQSALDLVGSGKAFRGEYRDPEAIKHRFAKCDALYNTIKEHGYKSNRRLYSEGTIDNILEVMDEITVNIGRDGNIILNDGWHRFCTVRMLGSCEIPVRVCAIHPQSKLPTDQ